MGKDNIVFHTIIWPAELIGYDTGGELGAGRALTLPDNVAACEFLTMERQQFSASRGVGIFVKDFLERYDADALRYYLIAAGPETHDTDFTWAEFVRRNNDELVATWGNLVNRTLTSTYRNFGAVPEPGELTERDRQLTAAVDAGFEAVGVQIDAVRFRAALAEAMRLASLVNEYTSEQAPWALVKSDRERAATVLYVALRCIDSLKMLFTPFLPFSAQRLHELLGYEGEIGGPPEDVQRDGRGWARIRRPDGRLRAPGRTVGAKLAPARTAAGRAEAPLQEARPRQGGRGRARADGRRCPWR